MEAEAVLGASIDKIEAKLKIKADLNPKHVISEENSMNSSSELDDVMPKADSNLPTIMQKGKIQKSATKIMDEMLGFADEVAAESNSMLSPKVENIDEDDSPKSI